MLPRSKGKQRYYPAIFLARFVSAALAIGCATYTSPSSNGAGNDISAASARPSEDHEASVSTANRGDDDSGVLIDALYRSRMGAEPRETSPRNFTLGPGDVLRISVPLIEQLKERTVRVSEDDTIALPLVGVITVTGMTEEGLRKDLIRRVAKYMYHPQVEVFLQHTENREVAVLGSVKKPGRYMLASRTDSIMTMISRAGGLNDDAATRIMLFPAPPSAAHQVSLSTAGAPNGNLPTDRIPPLTLLAKNDVTKESVADVSEGSLKNADAPIEANRNERTPTDELVIDLARPDNQRYVEMPARPGDVIVVPAAGEVTVQGWVDKPGAFKITPGLTTLGSIAAAGGPNFTSSATLLREQRDGSKLSIPLDLSRMKHGEETDLPVRGGDVIIVEKSVAGAVPYSIYFLLNKLYLGVPY